MQTIYLVLAGAGIAWVSTFIVLLAVMVIQRHLDNRK